MESEKVKEIKKALEHCGEKVTCQGCPEYNNEPVIDWFKCKKNLLQKTITLINELESENERLNECYKVKAYDKLRAENKKLKDRIAELEKEVETRKEEVLHLQEYGKALIRETELKQFAERLKEKSAYSFIFGKKFIVEKDIDETLKEVLDV